MQTVHVELQQEEWVRVAPGSLSVNGYEYLEQTVCVNI